MSIDVAIATLSALSGPAVKAAYEVLKRHIADKTATRLPEQIETYSDIRAIETIAHEVDQQLSPDESVRISSDSLNVARQDLLEHRRERMRQAKNTFNAALTLAILGVLIIFAGVLLVLLRDASIAGSVTVAIGAVVEIVSALLFRFNKDANDRLDEIGKNVQLIEAAQLSMSLILKIEDPKTRDEAIREAAADLRHLGMISRADK